jgi:D-alanyl-D-alanine carboxypeptidase (penicillin-binding protein 5/6)
MTVAAASAAPVGPDAPVPRDRFPKAAASYVVALDGKVLWERDADTPRPPASLTKIMTALVLLDGAWKQDAIVTVSACAAAATGTRLGLRAGDRMSAGDLLTAMLVASANDAAIALAEHRAGSVERFVTTMNEKAEAIGLVTTGFVNPTGFDAAGQRSSARDLHRLVEAALEQPEFARRVGLDSVRVATAAGRTFDLTTSNALLGRVDGAIGVKTGFTSLAGKCLVALVERDGHRVLAVLLDAPDRWWAAEAIIDAAFDATRAPE